MQDVGFLLEEAQYGLAHAKKRVSSLINRATSFVPLTKLNEICPQKLLNVCVECLLPNSTAVRLNPIRCRLNTALCRNQMPLVDEMRYVEV